MIDCLLVCPCVGPVMDWQPVQGAANLSLHDSLAICCEGMHYANETLLQKQEVFSGCFYIYLPLYLLFILQTIQAICKAYSPEHRDHNTIEYLPSIAGILQ